MRLKLREINRTASGCDFISILHFVFDELKQSDLIDVFGEFRDQARTTKIAPGLDSATFHTILSLITPVFPTFLDTFLLSRF